VWKKKIVVVNKEKKDSLSGKYRYLGVEKKDSSSVSA
jgi:hypothetical protein